MEDTFAALSRVFSEERLAHLGGICPSVRFTVEKEVDGVSPFPDTLLTRRMKIVWISLSTTYADCYLHFHSHNPTLVKRDVLKSSVYMRKPEEL